MFPRIVNVKKDNKVLSYLRVVENYRQKGKRKQKIIANFGRMDLIGGTLGELMKKLRKYTSEVLVTPEEIKSKAVFEYGPLLVGQKLWEEIGIGKLLRDNFKNLKIGEKGESQVLALVLNRLINPGSDLGMMDWLDEIYLPEFQNKLFGNSQEDERARVNRFYRCLDQLIKQKEPVEQHLWNFISTLFPVDLIFYDIANVQFEGEGPAIARIGNPKLGKRNHNQVLIGLVVTNGFPVSHHIFRGNRAEKTTIKWISQAVKKKYNVSRVIYVMDRGMISVGNLEHIEDQEDGYIVGVKRRENNEIKMLLEKDLTHFEKIKENLFAKEIKVYSTKLVGEIDTNWFKKEHKGPHKIIDKILRKHNINLCDDATVISGNLVKVFTELIKIPNLIQLLEENKVKSGVLAEEATEETVIKNKQKMVQLYPHSLEKTRIKNEVTRLVLGYNPERAKEDKEKREEILESLKSDLEHLQKRVESGEFKETKPIIAKAEEILRQRHGKRYLDYKAETDKFEYYLKEDKIKQEEKIDGKFIIKTREEGLTTAEVVLRYKDLMDVESLFKQLKSNLEVGPIYHYTDRRVKAHIFVCILALFLQRYLEEKLERAKIKISSQKALEKLKRIKVVINQVGPLTLKYVTPPSVDNLELILRSVGITNLPNILSDIRPVRQNNVKIERTTERACISLV